MDIIARAGLHASILRHHKRHRRTQQQVDESSSSSSSSAAAAAGHKPPPTSASVRGLPNSSLCCYLNSLIQSYASLNNSLTRRLCYLTKPENTQRPLVTALLRVVGYVNGDGGVDGDRGPPRDALQVVRGFLLERGFWSFTQQDVHEAHTLILDEIDGYFREAYLQECRAHSTRTLLQAATSSDSSSPREEPTPSTGPPSDSQPPDDHLLQMSPLPPPPIPLKTGLLRKTRWCQRCGCLARCKYEEMGDVLLPLPYYAPPGAGGGGGGGWGSSSFPVSLVGLMAGEWRARVLEDVACARCTCDDIGRELRERMGLFQEPSSAGATSEQDIPHPPFSTSLALLPCVWHLLCLRRTLKALLAFMAPFAATQQNQCYPATALPDIEAIQHALRAIIASHLQTTGDSSLIASLSQIASREIKTSQVEETALEKPPEMLGVLIQRVNVQGGFGAGSLAVKNDRPVAFPLVMDLPLSGSGQGASSGGESVGQSAARCAMPVSRSWHSSNAGAVEIDPQEPASAPPERVSPCPSPCVPRQPPHCRYTMAAVMCHSGSATAGHYSAYRRKRQRGCHSLLEIIGKHMPTPPAAAAGAGAYDDGAFVYASDLLVRDVPSAEVAAAQSSAYFLFYERH
ncbi:unnamed protein product [Vitrella brassicaformis CCMP3155]|uniref:ubiquitinyl hydrolase 1 n=2 Tax=Vitrella brassicaformis TaxID=1169539 RepID=A0A0G4ECB2_VITBC|nr:unnamed protein product [Vitrella brassicaformis CCMP3155]|eukprot:CEL92979.1 unnamed protein product [Vitrella brassicaformis CCMP3155]